MGYIEYYIDEYEYFATMICHLILVFDVLIHTLVVYCSYEFGYIPYLKLYGKFHKCVYKLFERITINQYHKKWKQYKINQPFELNQQQNDLSYFLME